MVIIEMNHYAHKFKSTKSEELKKCNAYDPTSNNRQINHLKKIP